jgi:hypothetical protein
VRKIEQQMVKAVKAKEGLYKDNTSVMHNPSLNTSNIYLHGNHIATYYHVNGRLKVNIDTLKRWPTNTTKSRLRALGANLVSKRGKLYLDDKEV